MMTISSNWQWALAIISDISWAKRYLKIIISRLSYITIIEKCGCFSITDKDPLQVFRPSLKEAHSVSITYFKSLLWDLVLTFLQNIYMSICRRS